jgi:hypothetical protein
VKGGHYGDLPNLTKLDAGDNLNHHGPPPTMVEGHSRNRAGANGSFKPFEMFV